MPKRTLQAAILTVGLNLWLFSGPCGAQGTPTILDSRQQNIGPITCDIPKATPQPSPTPSAGPSRRGFVFAKEGGVVLRDKPSPNAKRIWTAPPGTRLAYTDVVYDKSGKAEWYHVPRGYNPNAGWISANDAATRFPSIPPAGTKIIIKDSGLGEVKVTASVCAGFRG